MSRFWNSFRARLFILVILGVVPLWELCSTVRGNSAAWPRNTLRRAFLGLPRTFPRISI